MNGLQNIPIDKIRLGRNPRTKFDPEKLEGLANSIRTRGQKQAIVVEPDRDGYLLVMGERRLRAARMLKQTHIQAFVRPATNHDGRERFIDALIENDQREEMTPMDTARAYRVLHDEYGMTVRQISKLIGKSEAVINNLLVLTDLDEEIQTMIDQGLWKDPRLARALLRIDDPETRIQLAARLWKNKTRLKTCLKAVEAAIVELKRARGIRVIDFKRGTPSLQLAKAEEKPTGWDMLKQLGRVPAWSAVVQSAERTCELCPLRPMANAVNCKDCGAVALLRNMMEAAQ